MRIEERALFGRAGAGRAVVFANCLARLALRRSRGAQRGKNGEEPDKLFFSRLRPCSLWAIPRGSGIDPSKAKGCGTSGCASQFHSLRAAGCRADFESGK